MNDCRREMKSRTRKKYIKKTVPLKEKQEQGEGKKKGEVEKEGR